MWRSLLFSSALSSLVGCSCAPAHSAPDAPTTDGGVPALDAPTLDGSLLDAASHDGGPPDVAIATDAPADALLDVPTDAGPPCETPLTWIADTTTEGPATAAVAALSSTAVPTWNDARGTFETIFTIDVPLSCPAGAEAWDTLRLFIEANVAIFQIDVTEWETPSSFPCDAVSPTNDYFRIDRRDFGPGTVAHDFVSFAIRRDGTDGIVLRAVIANYLPPVRDDIATEMARCGGLSLERARAAVFRETFSYSTFERCVPSGSGTYTPGPLDVVTLDAPRWNWTERLDGTGVELTSEQPGTLIIDASYVTPELVQSDLNCPNEAGDARVYGYRLLFDSATGAILSALPGVGCIVC